MYLTRIDLMVVDVADFACFLDHKRSIICMCIAYGKRRAAAESETSKYCFVAMCLSFVSLTLVTMFTKPPCLCDKLHCLQDGNTAIRKRHVLSLAPTSWSQRYPIYHSCFDNFTYNHYSVPRKLIFPQILRKFESNISNVLIQIA